MEAWSIIAARWPGCVFELRRRCAVDADFREVVADFEQAHIALDRWRAIDPPGSKRVTDYETILRELEDEIESWITR